MAHKVKPGGDPSRNIKPTLVAIIDDHPVADFAHEYVSLLLGRYVTQDALSLPEKAIAEVLPDFDARQLAANILEALVELPFKYTFSIPLNAALGALIPDGEDAISINDRMRLVRVTSDFWERFPETEPTAVRRIADVFADASYRPMALETAVLQIDADGFATRFGATATVTDALLLAKAFFGLCVALGILVPSYGISFDMRREAMSFHRTSPPELVGRRAFDHDAGRYLAGLTVHSRANSTGSGVAQPYLRTALEAVGVCLGAGEEARRLRLAGRWFFDSSVTSDEVTAFVQAMIVMETLLGEEDASS
ncbi:hypothetical protein OIU35_26765 [Boseaceae bacterium BT-24-1]|nr:hypothetical protein [Boseaceae bacterium BT-24-1]